MTNTESGNITTKPGAANMNYEGQTPTPWICAYFAKEWFNDAVAEKNAGSGRAHRRREIIFAVAFAESYLVEWVRDGFLKDYKELENFIPSGDRRGVSEKWKEVTQKLVDENLLKGCPDLGTKFWCDWMKLVDYRNGLIHARLSRPMTGYISEKLKPEPNTNALDEMTPGWPISVAVAMIKEFHKAASMPLPTWMAV